MIEKSQNGICVPGTFRKGQWQNPDRNTLLESTKTHLALVSSPMGG